MNTALECMPCFMKMALRDARLASPDDEAKHYAIIAAWGRKLGELDLSVPPPAIARCLLDIIESETGCGDLYAEDKRDSNERALQLLPKLKTMVAAERDRVGGDPLALAMELAIIGNYIDRGVDIDVDWENELSNVSDSIDATVFAKFRQRVVPGAHILILGDNTGEIVIDTLLVEELQRLGCNVTYAVRSRPIINDATIADARAVGMTRLCHVVESGVDTPGTVVEKCSPEFLKRMHEVDAILSKGQGNFESLEGAVAGIFCAFKVKCKRVARDAGLPMGSSAFCITNPPNESASTNCSASGAGK